VQYKIITNVKRNSMRTTATFSINLPYGLKKEGKHVVARCQLLGVSAFGKSKEEAVALLIEAVELFITTCFEMGTLEQVLKESGFVKTAQEPARSRQRISVPLPEDLSLRLAQCLA
jgi:predicted RNase H-like HicB family nuclease